MMADQGAVFSQLVLGADRAVLGPAHILGAEQEFEVFLGRQRKNFRHYFDRVLARSGRRYRLADPFSAHVDTGALYCCDGWEAEVAVPPQPLHLGACTELARSMLAHRGQFVQSVDTYNAGNDDALHLEGYSTHLSAFCIDVDGYALARRYATTMAPAMMMLLDMEHSPGLLVRPRLRRFEVGGEYVPTEDSLIAAVVFFVGLYLATWDAVSIGSPEMLPLHFDADHLKDAGVRPGYFVSRDAFGEDLYTRGRAARLRCTDGEELLLVGDYIAGKKKLPLEINDHAMTVRPSKYAVPGSLYRRAFEVHQRPGFDVRPQFVAWNHIVFAVERSGKSTIFANVPYHGLDRFFAQLYAGALDEVLVVTASAQQSSRVLDEPSLVEFPGIFDEFDEDAFRGGKKKKKKEEGSDCAVRLIEEKDDERDYPIIEICVPATRDPLIPIKTVEPPLNAATGGFGIQLHSGAFHMSDLDLQVKAKGMPFQLLRHYRSGIDYDGIIGRGWEHIYNKRIIPFAPQDASKIVWVV